MIIWGVQLSRGVSRVDWEEAEAEEDIAYSSERVVGEGVRLHKIESPQD